MLYSNLLNSFKQNYIGYATLGLLFQSCLGGVTSMLILHQPNGILKSVQLLVVVSLCMAYNASMMAGLSKKVVLNLLLASVIINLFLAAVSLVYMTVA